MTDAVRTVYLGQYTHEHAETIAGELEATGIVWWYKAPGYLSQIWERGVRLFVDRERLDEAKAIAERVLGTPPEGGARGENPTPEPQPPEGEGSSSGQT